MPPSYPTTFLSPVTWCSLPASILEFWISCSETVSALVGDELRRLLQKVAPIMVSLVPMCSNDSLASLSNFHGPLSSRILDHSACPLTFVRFVFRPFWKILSLSSLCFWALPPSPATNSAFSHSLTQFSTYVHDTKWTWVLTLKKLHYPRNPVFMQFHRKVYMQSFQHTLNITNNTRNTVCKVNDYLDNLMTQIFSKKYFPFTLAPTNTYSKNWEKISLVFHRKIIWWIVWYYTFDGSGTLQEI